MVVPTNIGNYNTKTCDGRKNDHGTKTHENKNVCHCTCNKNSLGILCFHLPSTKPLYKIKFKQIINTHIILQTYIFYYIL